MSKGLPPTAKVRRACVRALAVAALERAIHFGLGVTEAERLRAYARLSRLLILRPMGSGLCPSAGLGEQLGLSSSRAFSISCSVSLKSPELRRLAVLALRSRGGASDADDEGGRDCTMGLDTERWSDDARGVLNASPTAVGLRSCGDKGTVKLPS